jgi:hypothetical protein
MLVAMFFCLARVKAVDINQGVLNDTILGINVSDIESIASETCNSHILGQLNPSRSRDHEALLRGMRYASVTQSDQSATHGLYTSYVVLDSRRRHASSGECFSW